jgi:hypothetical protein
MLINTLQRKELGAWKVIVTTTTTTTTTIIIIIIIIIILSLEMWPVTSSCHYALGVPKQLMNFINVSSRVLWCM